MVIGKCLFNMEGEINIKLEGATLQETERCRRIIHELFTQGFFALRNGKAIVHFDHTAEMQQIEYDFIKWRRGKDAPLQHPPLVANMVSTLRSQPIH